MPFTRPIELSEVPLNLLGGKVAEQVIGAAMDDADIWDRLMHPDLRIETPHDIEGRVPGVPEVDDGNTFLFQIERIRLPDGPFLLADEVARITLRKAVTQTRYDAPVLQEVLDLGGDEPSEGLVTGTVEVDAVPGIVPPVQKPRVVGQGRISVHKPKVVLVTIAAKPFIKFKERFEHNILLLLLDGPSPDVLARILFFFLQLLGSGPGLLMLI
jgi:hypothetical protein